MMDQTFRRYLEQCPDGVLATDRGGRIQYVNSAFERLTGYRAAELVGRTPALLKSGMHEADFYRSLWAALLAGQDFRAVFCNRRKGGELYYEDKIIRPVEGGFVSFGRDVTASSREIEKLAHAATHDSLTGLPNRRLFADRLQQALAHAERRGEALTVALIDVDRFRDTNNRYGHLAGDAVLQAIAQRTLSCVRASDTVARIGGDEFAVVLVDAGGADAARVLEAIVAANASAVDYEGGVLPVGVSIGACGFPHEAGSALELQRLADLRMYEAKRAGGSRYVFPSGAENSSLPPASNRP
jgi:diguanylate cyclase (GGDEF)-like protein/PAS domain S-box-containing protein